MVSTRIQGFAIQRVWITNIWIANFHLSDTDVRYSNGIQNNGPFGDRTTFDHSNTRLVRYSDPHCITKKGFWEINFKNELSKPVNNNIMKVTYLIFSWSSKSNLKQLNNICLFKKGWNETRFYYASVLFYCLLIFKFDPKIFCFFNSDTTPTFTSPWKITLNSLVIF